MANISYGVNIIPKTNNTYTLGNSDYKWSNIYTVQINGTNVSNLATNTTATTSTAGLMSAADKTKLNAFDAREWEVIREDTFTNAEEADHTITVDGNGNAFDLTDVFFMFETPRSATVASAKGRYGQIHFYYDATNYFASESGAWTQAADTVSHGFVVKITQELGGLFLCQETQQTTSTNSAAWRTRYYGGFTGNGQGAQRLTVTRHISKIVIPSVTGLGHYILIGKRAAS